MVNDRREPHQGTPCTQALRLIEGVDADALLGDKGYDTDEIIGHARGVGMCES